MGWIPFKRKEQVLANPEKYRGLIIRKYADKSIEILEPSDRYAIPTSYVEQAVQEGWMSYPDGYTVVHRPGGPKKTKWSTTHTFVHAPTIAIHTKQGEERFQVVQQPDKFGTDEANRDADGDFVQDQTAHVNWFYLVDRM